MSAGETARKNYESARNELVQRIQLREQILLFFVGGVATIYSVALGAENKLEILLAIPYISFGTAVIISQHNSVIGALGHFCAHELWPFLKKVGAFRICAAVGELGIAASIFLQSARLADIGAHRADYHAGGAWAFDELAICTIS